ncbi:MAG TPA: hypothetical protein VG965_04175 [Patescibacteria group bacterium]|nr:hypothetical protein [Patescibacteria group bacterium]
MRTAEQTENQDDSRQNSTRHLFEAFRHIPIKGHAPLSPINSLVASSAPLAIDNEPTQDDLTQEKLDAELKEARRVMKAAEREVLKDEASRKYRTNFVSRGISRWLYHRGLVGIAERIAPDEARGRRLADATRGLEDAAARARRGVKDQKWAEPRTTLDPNPQTTPRTDPMPTSEPVVEINPQQELRAELEGVLAQLPLDPTRTPEQQQKIHNIAIEAALQIAELEDKREQEAKARATDPKPDEKSIVNRPTTKPRTYNPPPVREYLVRLSSPETTPAPANTSTPKLSTVVEGLKIETSYEEVKEPVSETIKRWDKMGIFEHTDRAARQRLANFLEGISITAHVTLEQMRELYGFDDPNNSTQLRALENFATKFFDLMHVDDKIKRSRLNDPNKHSAIHGISTIYSPDSSEIHGVRYSARNYKYNDPASTHFDIPGPSRRDRFRVTFFPLPYARYRVGGHPLPALDNLRPQEARSIMHARFPYRQAEVEDAINEAKKTLQMPHIEMSSYRDGLLTTTLRGELSEVLDGQNIRHDLNMSMAGFPEVNTVITIGSKPQRIILGQAPEEEIKSPLQKLAEDFAGLKKIHLY